MKKKTDRDILFERLGKVDPTFSKRIDENEEPKPFNSIDPNLERDTPEYDAAVAKHYEKQGYMPDGTTPLPEPNSAQKAAKNIGLNEEKFFQNINSIDDFEQPLEHAILLIQFIMNDRHFEENYDKATKRHFKLVWDGLNSMKEFVDKERKH